MKLSLIAAAAVLSFSFAALAEEKPIVRARFASTAAFGVLETVACTFVPTSTFDGAAHTFDVRIDGWRCTNEPAPAGAIPVFVRSQEDEVRHVVVEAPVPDGVDHDHLERAIADIAVELRRRVIAAAVPLQSSEPSPLDDPSKVLRRSRSEIVGGLLLLVPGSIATTGGLLSALGSRDATVPLVVAALGAIGLCVGIPLLVHGSKKIPRVTANVSPTGGSLRVSF